MNYNPEQINHLIQNRRSIFPNMYNDEPVNDAVIKQMLENANWAPTHRLTEPWRFVVFSGDGLKKLADFQSMLYKQIALNEDNFKEEKYEKLRTKPLLASHIIAIGMHRDENERVPEWEELASVASAVQNMYLTASAYGVGCYWTSGGVTRMQEANDFFGLGEKDVLLGFLFVGMPKGDWPKGRRGDWEEKVSWVG